MYLYFYFIIASDLIRACWNQDSKKRPNVEQILAILCEMQENKDIHNETNSFMGSKDDWEGEYEEQCDSLRTEQHRQR